MVVIIFKSVQYLCKMTLICIFKDEEITPERFSGIPKDPEPIFGELLVCSPRRQEEASAEFLCVQALWGGKEV